MVNYNEIFGVDDSYKAPEKIMKILYKKDEREKLFMKLLEANDYNVCFDWFHMYFQEEHADRKNKKQDFTPECVADLISKLAMTGAGNNGNYYEVCAGTGGLMIKHWDNYRKTMSPFRYKPSLHFAFVEELSDRTIPFLLLNMMIRGMNGIVLHGDCLRRKYKNAYFIQNLTDNHLGFSSITNIPHTEFWEKELAIKFISEDYIEHEELMDIETIGKILNIKKEVK